MEFENEHDAKEALDALPPLDKGAGFLRRPYFAWDLGRVYVLGGRPADAAPVLERASKTCYRLNRAVDLTRSFYFLGLAREKTGDVAGAREAYRESSSVGARRSLGRSPRRRPARGSGLCPSSLRAWRFPTP